MRTGMLRSPAPLLERAMPLFVRCHGLSRELGGFASRRRCIGTCNLDRGDKDCQWGWHEFSKPHSPNPISVKQLIIHCNTMRAQMAGERPHCRAKWLIVGAMANRGTKHSMHVKNSFFNPRRRRIFVKNKPWTTASSGPRIPRLNPILAGDIPSPPRWIGVARNRGPRAQNAMSRKESQR